MKQEQVKAASCRDNSLDYDEIPVEGDLHSRNSVNLYKSGSNNSILVSNKGKVKDKRKSTYFLTWMNSFEVGILKLCSITSVHL